jgi:hypothetical protein
LKDHTAMPMMASTAIGMPTRFLSAPLPVVAAAGAAESVDVDDVEDAAFEVVMTGEPVLNPVPDGVAGSVCMVYPSVPLGNSCIVLLINVPGRLVTFKIPCVE